MPKSFPELTLEYLEKDITVEWQRKAALDTKAVGLLTANLAATTLFFAARTQLGITTLDAHTAAAILAFTAIGFLASSLILAALSAIPRGYNGTSLQSLADLVAFANEHPTFDHAEGVAVIMRGRLEDLRQADRANGRRAILTYASFVLFTIAVAALIASLLAGAHDTGHAHNAPRHCGSPSVSERGCLR